MATFCHPELQLELNRPWTLHITNLSLVSGFADAGHAACCLSIAKVQYVGTNPVVTRWPGYWHMESAGARLQELMQEVDAASASSVSECVGKK
jgi:hypothetical protein